ncbi:YbjQ family protein [Mucilaginibacter galii]|uniref:UPF0145 protein GCM10011425_37070 n=1 Tax=Mucilaginibacter galii TaxID=2005073 RepID=A0A917JB56_9SPHI|nr:YbjQ family protein [Mucilaginibacter galii]GGI52495.1 hypothetical protein GCM10011425_37070 [Mucilaginibacter galii]
MPNPKDILVVTTSTIEGRKINRHLKPVTAHIVAGTNVFSDVFAAFSDFFGGRSGSYQKQLTSLYDEAIHKIKLAAYEIGANGVVGLSIDMDEISGKNKSMFMLTAIGTAVVLENDNQSAPITQSERFENVSYERLNLLYKKKDILKKADEGNLSITDDNWHFVTTNQVDEIFPYLLKKYQAVLQGQMLQITVKEYYDRLVAYIDAFPEEKKFTMLYESALNESNEVYLSVISNIINDLQLVDLNYTARLLGSDEFKKQRIGLQIITFNKPFYNKVDVQHLEDLKDFIQQNFKERGTRSTKKQMLSSKEKEIWNCECGKTNDVSAVNQYCDNCDKDIYGFKTNDITPEKAIKSVNTKIALISELII